MIHNTYNDLCLKTIQEYLDAAKRCLETKKKDDNAFGMAALVLVTAAIDAMGSFYKKDPKNTTKYLFVDNVDPTNVNTSNVDHFKAVYNEFFSNKKDFPEMQNVNEDDFKDIVYKKLRCKAVHNGVIEDFIALSEAGNAVLSDDKKTLYIDVLHTCVEKAYKIFIGNFTAEVPPQEDTKQSITGVTSTQTIQQHTK